MLCRERATDFWFCVGMCIARTLTPTTVAITSAAARKRLAISPLFFFISWQLKGGASGCQQQKFNVAHRFSVLNVTLKTNFLLSKAPINQSSLRPSYEKIHSTLLGASEATILSKRGSPRSGSQNE